MPDTDLAWLVPVLRRPHRVWPLLQAIENTTPNAQVVFITDPDDTLEHAAIRDGKAKSGLGIDTMVRTGGWAFKLNEAVRETTRPLLFLGADDLEPNADWLHHAESKITDRVRVIGVNDLIKRRRVHTTHFLMTRDYALEPMLDGSRGPAPEAYNHSFADDEIIATAQHRGAYAYAGAAKVRHFHPFGGAGQKAEDDEVYRLGRKRFRQDRMLFSERSELWM